MLVKKLFNLIVMAVIIAPAVNINLAQESSDPYTACFRLHQNEPAETADVTKIRFDLYCKGNVTLWILDEENKVVEELISGDMEEGQYAVYCEISRAMLEGDCLCRIQFDGMSREMKLQLSK